MNNKQKNAFIVISIIVVILLIVFNDSHKINSSESLSQAMPSPFFPVQKELQKEVMQALLTGELKLEGKCLKVNDNLIVWPYGYSLKIEEDTIKIFNDKAELAAIVGDTVKLGGGQVESSDALPEAFSEYQNSDCKGPFWIAGEVMPVKN